jgi:hypothetical protein
MSSFPKLFQREPDYSILKAFGCAFYPLLIAYAIHKLSFRSKQCILIGYSSNQHGYRCLDPFSKRVYVSQLVVFDEGLFPTKAFFLYCCSYLDNFFYFFTYTSFTIIHLKPHTHVLS